MVLYKHLSCIVVACNTHRGHHTVWSVWSRKGCQCGVAWGALTHWRRLWRENPPPALMHGRGKPERNFCGFFLRELQTSDWSQYSGTGSRKKMSNSKDRSGAKTNEWNQDRRKLISIWCYKYLSKFPSQTCGLASRILVAGQKPRPVVESCLTRNVAAISLPVTSRKHGAVFCRVHQNRSSSPSGSWLMIKSRRSRNERRGRWMRGS